MLTHQKELSQEQIADARKICQIKQGIQPVQWQLLSMKIFDGMEYKKG